METINLNRILPNSSSLDGIFNATKNPIACANYGGGVHCNQERINFKLKIWGNTNLQRNETDCMGAKTAERNGEAVALFNIGKTGIPATVKDRINDGEVYEFSGLMALDRLFASNVSCNQETTVSISQIQDSASGCFFEKNTDGLTSVANKFHNFLGSCTHNTGYTKAFVTFTPSHPYQEEFILQAGGKRLTLNNVESLLGPNSLHPERFRFDEEQLQECSKWGADQVSHDGWHDFSSCVEWINKTAMVLGVDKEAGFVRVEL